MNFSSIIAQLLTVTGVLTSLGQLKWEVGCCLGCRTGLKHQGHTSVWIVKLCVWDCGCEVSFLRWIHWWKHQETVRLVCVCVWWVWELWLWMWRLLFRMEALLKPTGNCATRVCLCLVSVRICDVCPCQWMPIASIIDPYHMEKLLFSYRFNMHA